MLYSPFCNSAEVCALALGIAQLLWQPKWLQEWLMHSHDVPCTAIPPHQFPRTHEDFTGSTIIFPFSWHCQWVSLFLPFLTVHVVQQIHRKEKWHRALFRWLAWVWLSEVGQNDCTCKEEEMEWRRNCSHGASCSAAVTSLLKLLICAAEALVLHQCGSVELLLLCTTTIAWTVVVEVGGYHMLSSCRLPFQPLHHTLAAHPSIDFYLTAS